MRPGGRADHRAGRGRRGAAHLGVPRAGALDAPAARLANRLVGNAEDDAVLETTLDGVQLPRRRPPRGRGHRRPRAGARRTGAPSSGASPWACGAASLVNVGPAVSGVRSYVAVAGGIARDAGARQPVDGHARPASARRVAADGQVLALGRSRPTIRPVSFTVPRPVGEVLLHLRVGPDDDWFGAAGVELLTGSTYTLSTDSNRVGARLIGPPIAWRTEEEMDSAGMVARRGAGAARRAAGRPARRPPDDRRLSGHRGGRRRGPGRARPGRAGDNRASAPDRRLTCRAIDLNSDLGEGFGVWRLGDDEALLRIVTSANAACGFHAGDPSIMRGVAMGAVAHDVAVGAQVSYRDLAGFGRRHMDIAPAELTDDVLYQLGALDGLCRVAGTRVRYVKPHGALYNTCVVDDGAGPGGGAGGHGVRRHAADPRVAGLGIAAARRAGRPAAVAEGFADRAYTPTGSSCRGPTLPPGHRPGAVVERSVRLATAGEVVAVDGSVLPMAVASLCVHGDTPGAVDLARRVRRHSGRPASTYIVSSLTVARHLLSL